MHRDEDTRSGESPSARPSRGPLEVADLETVAAPRGARFRREALGDRFVDALGYAALVHAGQLRGSDGQPYIAHLLRVSGLVIQEGGSEDEAIAALLHDAVEDQGGLDRLGDIRDRYGDAVADIVDECTDSYGEPKPPWRLRKERYLDGLERSSPGGLLVSLADKLDNARSMLRGHRIHHEELWERSGKDAADVRWYYETLASQFARLRPGPLADELARTVAALDREIAADAGYPVH